MNPLRALKLEGLKAWPWAAILLTLAAFAIHWSPAIQEALEHERGAVAAGEVHRILTCHWTHWSLDHLLWDALAFLALGALAESLSRARFLACLAVSALAIPLAVLALEPGIHVYRGLSGIDSALFAFAGFTILRDRLASGDRCLAAGIVAAFLGLGAKIAYEVLTGSTFFVDSASSSMVPVPAAHVVGAVVGAACAGFSPRQLLSSVPSAARIHPPGL
jgi:rhomboid family GlyGly-CTERM serine protease